jgi:cobaltochelatase CobN
MDQAATKPSRKRPLAQLAFCQGCCCGRTDRGRPELPVEMLKTIWKQEKLNRFVQLTISGCLGPCDQANVTLLLSEDRQVWLGGLHGHEVYSSLIDWARACGAAGELLPLPEALQTHEFSAFRECALHSAGD